MKMIYKYTLDIKQGIQEIEIPDYYAITLSVIEQEGHIVVYIEHDSKSYEKPTIPVFKKYQVVGTGEKFDKNSLIRFVGTVKVGDYVWHIYEG